MRLLLCVNESASSVTPRSRVVIRKALSADHEVELAETNRRGHATRLAQGAAHDGFDAVVALGGDGTLNEVANGLAGTDTALAVLPGGSTNVFARTIGLPNDPIEATGLLLDALARGSIRRVGLGSVNGRYFTFHTGVGWDAAVVEQVERRGRMKRYAGHPLFAWAALTTWARHYDRSEPHFRVVHADGSRVDGFLTIALNTNPYTFVGSRPFDLAPEATLDRGLAVVTLRTLDALPFLRIVAAALGVGPGYLRRSRHVDLRTDVSSFQVASARPFPYQVDGDHLGDTDDLVFRHEPEAMRLVLP